MSAPDAYRAALLALIVSSAGCVRADSRARTAAADAALVDAIGEGSSRELSGSCGNGKLDDGEECDAAELQGETCVSLRRGFTGGALSCKACRYDTSACFSSAAGHATLVYGTADKLVTGTLDTKTGAWGAATAVQLGAVRWVVNRISPLDPRDELAAVSALPGTNHSLVLLHNGATDETRPLLVPSGQADTRVFDLAYEQKSGEALLVYSDESSSPTYSTRRPGQGWSAAQKVFPGVSPGTGSVRWVVLVSRPRTDEIALLYSDTARRVYLVVWSGSDFLSSQASCLNCTASSTGYDTLSFGAAYEDQSGNLLAAAGDPCCSCLGFNYRRGAQGWVDGGSVCDFPWTTFQLASQRGTNAVALGGPSLSTAIWSGAGWYPAWLPPGPTPGNPGTEVAWVGGQPIAVAVHRDDPLGPLSTSRMSWSRSSIGGTWVQGDPFPVAGLGLLARAQLAAFPAEDRVLAAFSDDKGSLWVATYELSGGWALTNGGKPLAGTLSTVSTRAFSFDITQ